MKPFGLFLFIAIIVPECLSANCTLCSDGSPPTDPAAKLIIIDKNSDGTQTVTCEWANKEAPKGYFANCTELHQRGKDVCGCGKEPPKDCSLCQNGALPEPNKIVVGKSCSEWEQKAAKGFPDDCFSWQETFGISCGCVNQKSESFCNICDKELPNFEKVVKFSDNSEKTCIEIEREENAKIATKQTSCTTEQSRYSNVCDCNPSPTVAPTQSSSSTIQTLKIYPFVVFVSYTLSLKMI